MVDEPPWATENFGLLYGRKATLQTVPVRALKWILVLVAASWAPAPGLRAGESGSCVGSLQSQKAKVLLVVCRGAVGPKHRGKF